MSKLHNFIAFFVLLLSTVSSDDSSSPNGASKQSARIKEDGEQTKRIPFVRSILDSKHRVKDERNRTMQTYWEEAFKEIRKLAVNFTKTTSGGPGVLTQWKLLLDDYQRGPNVTASAMSFSDEMAAGKRLRRVSLPRFEGFASWERQLQQWADDIADYVEKQQVEEGEYPFSTYGKPTDSLEYENRTTDAATLTPLKSERAEDTSVPPVSLVLPLVNDTKKKLPIPVPAKPGEAVLPHTDVSDKSKRILIVTTAALPWMTGTAVNPLLRAAYLTRGRSKAGGSVTLMLPWVERESDQHRVYGKDRQFKTQEDQEDYIRTWLRDTAGMKEASEELQIRWYTAWQERAENSLYSMGDITALVSAEDVDICVLEEPEHLNWYRAPGESWTRKFKHCIGIVHTNYFAYAQEQPAALVRAPAMKLLCSWMCRAHCHRLIKLSGTLGQFAPEKELVENVHGVRGRFLEIGQELKQKLLSPGGATDSVFGPEAEPSVYFIGKMLWSKGLGSLMELLKYAEENANLKIKVDMYGGGPDKDAAAARSKKLELEMPFHGPVDHAELGMSHKIFINPSTTEVLCTTVAEALAMGKFVVLPSHPSNDFFAQFPNCLPYASKEEFVGNVYYALTHSPEPLTDAYSYALTWEAATERLEAAGAIPVAEAEQMAEVFSSDDTGIDITLPPLIENDVRRKKLADSIKRSRDRYRLFRTRLSQEIKRSNVLPDDLEIRILQELDKRLDLDIDAILESPKLRLQLSPAELDKRLLDFYEGVSEGPTGDLLRIIGGGANVGRQNLYMKQQAQKLRRQERKGFPYELQTPLLPAWAETEPTEESDSRVTQWVKLALRQNLPARNTNFVSKSKELSSLRAKNEEKTKMCIGFSAPFHYRNSQPLASRSRLSMSFRPPTMTRASLLI